jgi:hypothetical protein
MTALAIIEDAVFVDPHPSNLVVIDFDRERATAEKYGFSGEAS